MGYVFKAFLLSPFMRQHGSMYLSSPNNKDLVVLKELIEAGKVTPVIDRTYPLSDATEAFWYLEEEHARGKVLITVEHNNLSSEMRRGKQRLRPSHPNARD